MDIGRFLEYLVENGRTLRMIAYVVLAGLVIADILIPSAYDRFFWEQIGGFGAIYGFVSCALLIAVAKGLGYAFLYRREDYYDE